MKAALSDSENGAAYVVIEFSKGSENFSGTDADIRPLYDAYIRWLQRDEGQADPGRKPSDIVTASRAKGKNDYTRPDAYTPARYGPIKPIHTL